MFFFLTNNRLYIFNKCQLKLVLNQKKRLFGLAVPRKNNEKNLQVYDEKNTESRKF